MNIFVRRLLSRFLRLKNAHKKLQKKCLSESPLNCTSHCACIKSLTSIDDSFVKMRRIVEPNNLYLQLARNWYWQRKWTTASSFSADLYPRQKSLDGSYIVSYRSVRLARSGSSDQITKLTWTRIATRFDATGERSPCTDQIPPKKG